jgi:hypothetical protein
MSTINSKNVQVGTSGIAAQNFTLYQPNTPDGTVRLGVGNSGATTGDVVTVNSAGVTVTGSLAATSVSGSGASLTTLNASNLSTGTVGTARLATGTANNTTYLRGDQTWATVSTTPTTAQVLSATAGLTAGDVGSYGFVRTAANNPGGAINPGTTIAGSNIRWGGGDTGSALSGTWRWLGTGAAQDPCSGNWLARATVAVRIS